MEGLLPEVQRQIIANFYGKNVSKGKMYTFQHFNQMGCKKTTIYCVMQLVDAGESVAQKEGQGRPRKLTFVSLDQIKYFDHSERRPLCDLSLICIIELIRR